MKFSPAAVEATESPAPTLRRSTRKAALEANKKLLTPQSSKTRQVARSARATPTRKTNVPPTAAPNNLGSAQYPEVRNDDSEPRTPPAGAASASPERTTPRRLFDEPSNATKASPAPNLRRSNRKAARQATELVCTPPRHATPARNAVVPPARRLFEFGGGAGTRTPPRVSFHREGTPRPAPVATTPDRPATAPRTPSAKTHAASPHRCSSTAKNKRHRRSPTTKNTKLTTRRTMCAVKPDLLAIDERKPLAQTSPLGRSSGLRDDGASKFTKKSKWSKQLMRRLHKWKYNWGAMKSCKVESDYVIRFIFRRCDGKLLEVMLACATEGNLIYGRRVLSRRTYHPGFPSFIFGRWI
mmetsp:Transcript_19505/g.40861  ORF Transcript_19505/g.40861 Transcript_19505/m.40861 type:complete len:355 (-) Transcript_19505:162-1226(-)